MELLLAHTLPDMRASAAQRAARLLPASLASNPDAALALAQPADGEPAHGAGVGAASTIMQISLVTDRARASLPQPAAALDASWPGPITDCFVASAKKTPDATVRCVRVV